MLAQTVSRTDEVEMQMPFIRMCGQEEDYREFDTAEASLSNYKNHAA